MKDYTGFLDINKKTFIKSYKVEEDDLILYLANGEEYVIPNTPQNLEKVVKRMKNQIELANGSLTKLKVNLGANLFLIVFFFVILNNYGINFNVIKEMALFNKILINTVISISAISFFYNVYKFFLHKGLIKDIKKNVFLLENDKYLNDNVKRNHNVLNNVSKKAINNVSDEENEETFNLSNIDNFSYKDILTIKENIDREIEFDFDYSEEKPKTKTLRR